MKGGADMGNGTKVCLNLQPATVTTAGMVRSD
jgi:hypothetical protein